MTYWCCGERFADFFEALAAARKRLTTSATDVVVHELMPDQQHPGIENTREVAILRKSQLRALAAA